jgi:hypothetical protein
MSIFDEAAVDALSISEIASAASSIYNVALTDTLTISEEYFAIQFEASDTLSITDEATVDVEFNVAATDALTLTDLYTDVWVWNTDAADDLEMTVEQFIPETLTYETIDVGLRDEANAGGFVSLAISDVLSLTELANGWIIPAAGATETATDTLTFTESPRFTVEDRASDYLGLVDEATAIISRPADDTLDFTDSATSVVDYNDMQAADTLNLSESVNVILVEFQVTCRPEFTYSPYIDPYQTEYVPADPNDIGFRLYYPATGAITDKLFLPNPNFGNKDRVTPRRVNNQTRGGDLIIFNDPAWGDPIETLLFSFSVLTAAQVAELQTWYDTYLGQEIRLVDQEDRIWRGMLTVVTDPMVHDRRKSYTASFEFEGAKVP